MALLDPAFTGSRKPLSAQFEFNGEIITALSIHSTSRIGSDPYMGSNQPPARRSTTATARPGSSGDHHSTACVATSLKWRWR